MVRNILKKAVVLIWLLIGGINLVHADEHTWFSEDLDNAEYIEITVHTKEMGDNIHRYKLSNPTTLHAIATIVRYESSNDSYDRMNKKSELWLNKGLTKEQVDYLTK